MRRWFTTDRIAGIQLAIMVIIGLAAALLLAWVTTRGSGLGWFTSP